MAGRAFILVRKMDLRHSLETFVVVFIFRQLHIVCSLGQLGLMVFNARTHILFSLFFSAGNNLRQQGWMDHWPMMQTWYYWPPYCWYHHKGKEEASKASLTKEIDTNNACVDVICITNGSFQ